MDLKILFIHLNHFNFILIVYNVFYVVIASSILKTVILMIFITVLPTK